MTEVFHFILDGRKRNDHNEESCQKVVKKER